MSPPPSCARNAHPGSLVLLGPPARARYTRVFPGSSPMRAGNFRSSSAPCSLNRGRPQVLVRLRRYKGQVRGHDQGGYRRPTEGRARSSRGCVWCRELVIPERRRRTPEIINVDELEDDIVPRPRQRCRVNRPDDRDAIVISDNEAHTGPSQSRANQSPDAVTPANPTAAPQ
ncbi:hypothetical protein FIBSPDRAFT_964271 [Athelia psychrophila]|uniref:Uncharacterized protein n=1 Tax=Athelia psychrophila TaxID=1759441 RepID=A0A165XXT0_9AGAM|nr:hypothetical protein FIBSPDRAFT_964271 [Fibularhizoctonia sp. CBS 109695]